MPSPGFPDYYLGKRSPLSENRSVDNSLSKRPRPSEREWSQRVISPRARAAEAAEHAAALEAAAWHDAAAAACEETDAGTRAEAATMAATRARWHAEAVAATVAARAAVAVAAPFDAMHIL